MTKITQHVLFETITLGILCTIWLYPTLLSSTGIALVITWAYSVLVAKILRVTVQYSMLKWGVNRQGMIVFGLGVAALGASVMYYAYTQQIYLYLGLGWVICYAGFESARHVYNRRVANVTYQFITTLEYAVVTLMALALFGGYIAESPIGRLHIEYHGLRGESLLFIAIMMTGCGVLHESWFIIVSKIKRLVKK